MTIFINESCGSCFAGYIGEHLATEAVFTVPERIADCDYYRVAFGINGTVIRTEELAPAEGESSVVRVLLWQELTLSKILTATLEGYIGDRYIGKGAQVTLRFEKAVGGDESEADTDPHGMQIDVFNLQGEVSGINDAIADLDPIVRANESAVKVLNKQTLIANGSLTIDLSNGSHCFVSVEGDCTITLESAKLTPFCLYFSNPDGYEVTITDAEYMQGVAPRILSENYQMIGDFEAVPKIAGVIETIDAVDLTMASIGGDEI